MALARIRPLDVQVLFQDRPYRLGEAIDLQVELSARGDVEVREARVDLVCEEDYVESYTVMVPDQANITTQARSPGGFYIPPPLIPKDVKKEHKETYVHSSVVFLTDRWFSTDTRDSYAARLEIEPQAPPHVSIAIVKWRLETVVDVARARDVKTRHKVTIKLK